MVKGRSSAKKDQSAYDCGHSWNRLREPKRFREVGMWLCPELKRYHGLSIDYGHVNRANEVLNFQPLDSGLLCSRKPNLIVSFGVDSLFPTFPTLTCGVFVFSAASAPSSFLPPACPPILPHTISSSITSNASLTHTHHSHTHTSHTLTLTHTHTSSLTHTHIPHTISSSITSKTSLTHTHIPQTISSSVTSNTSLTHTSFSHTHHSGSDVRPGVLWSPPLCRWLLRGRRGTWCTLKGSDVRPGVLRCPSGVLPVSLRSPSGVPLVSLRCPSGVPCMVSAALPVAFAWQAWDLVRCKGVGCTPRCASGVPPVSLGLRRSAGGFCLAGVSLRCPLVSAALPVAFAWQARGNVHCQGVGCTPRCPSAVPWSPPLCRWLSPGRRGAINLHGQGVGCTPRCPSGVPWSLPLCRWLLHGRRGTMCVAKGSDVRPVGFCVAGLGQCALPRGRMYAPVSLWRPLVSAALPVMYQLSSFRLITCELIMVCLCTWRSPPSLRVADVAHGDIYLGFAWQAWRL